MVRMNMAGWTFKVWMGEVRSLNMEGFLSEVGDLLGDELPCNQDEGAALQGLEHDVDGCFMQSATRGHVIAQEQKQSLFG